MKKNRMYSFILSSLAIGLVGFNAFGSITSGTRLDSCRNNSCVEVLDKSHSLIHSNN